MKCTSPNWGGLVIYGYKISVLKTNNIVILLEYNSPTCFWGLFTLNNVQIYKLVVNTSCKIECPIYCGKFKKD